MTPTAFGRVAAFAAVVATAIGASCALGAPLAAAPVPQTVAAQTAPVVFADTVIASGNTWKKKTSKTTGAWEIVRKDDGSRVLRLKGDFKTKRAPDLKIVLSPHTAKSAKNKNALEGGKVLGLLKSNKGAQEFAIPAGVDLASFKSVLIHCEQYTKLWSVSELAPTS